MAWDKGGVIHSPALSSGCTMNLLPDKHISYLEYPRHTNKHGFLSKIWEINENCWDEKLQGLVAGLLSLSSFLIPFIDHVYLQWDSPALSISFLYCPIAPSLTHEILVFSVCLVQQAAPSQAKRNVCRALRNVFLPRGLTWHLLLCLQPAVRVATCRCADKTLTSSLSKHWERQILKSSRKSPCKVAELSAGSRAKTMTCNLPVFWVFCGFESPGCPSPPGACCVSKKMLLLGGAAQPLGCKPLRAMQITSDHQMISHEANGASNGCTDYGF